MKAPRRFTLILTLASVILLGLALWYFQPHAAPPAAAPIAQTKPAAPDAKPQDTSSTAQQPQSVVGQSAPAPTAAPAPAKIASSASPAAPSQNVPGTAQLPPAYEAPPLPTVLAPIPQDAIERPTAVVATARMYAAHASLRTPEVSDPDSKANKQVLQTMVLKALAQPATPPPAVAVKR